MMHCKITPINHYDDRHMSTVDNSLKVKCIKKIILYNPFLVHQLSRSPIRN